MMQVTGRFMTFCSSGRLPKSKDFCRTLSSFVKKMMIGRKKTRGGREGRLGVERVQYITHVKTLYEDPHVMKTPVPFDLKTKQSYSCSIT